MLNYLYITNQPLVAAFVESCGVQRIFVDLEINGKEERQGHLDTVISKHSFDDIKSIKKSLTTAELLVRLNPFYSGSEVEIDTAIAAGADIIMLPMIKNIAEVSEFGRLIDGRAKLMPLIETVYSAENIKAIHDSEYVDELHIGLNDLHLELGLTFMFQLISNGMVKKMVEGLSKPFGIGGIARVGVGGIPGELVLAQHVELGSSGVILSRAFHADTQSVESLNSEFDFLTELKKLNTEYLLLKERDSLDDLVIEFNYKVVELVKLLESKKYETVI